MRVAIHTLGCKVNQYESQAMEEILTARGHTLVPFEDPADVYIVNSCTVTATSDKKSRQAVRQARKRAPEALVALCGCYPQVSPEDARKIDADLIAGGLEGRTRAMLKVEDGCTNFCTYCIIPYARGAVRSLPADQAAEQAKGLARQGYRELVITGIELSTYGRDLPGRPDLASLIEAVCHAVPEMRVRLGSLEPRTVTEDFCARLAALPNLCPHFHLSLQSGSDTVLARMKRKYTTQRFLESVRLLRTHFDRPALTTDLIVGFPGETEEEFQETLAFLQRCAFAQMHIFPYSRRQGTPAASMPGQLSNAEKAGRAPRGAELAQAMERSWLTGWIGQTVPVLFEEEKEGFWRGHTPQYIEVRVKGEHLHNQLRPVTITAAGDSLAYGTVKEEQP